MRPPRTPEELIRSVERRCLGPLPEERRRKVQTLLALGRVEEAAALAARGRPGCGYDVNALILAGPLDGQEHAARCPACGVEITYRAPRWP